LVNAAGVVANARLAAVLATPSSTTGFISPSTTKHDRRFNDEKFVFKEKSQSRLITTESASPSLDAPRRTR